MNRVTKFSLLLLVALVGCVGAFFSLQHENVRQPVLSQHTTQVNISNTATVTPTVVQPVMSLPRTVAPQPVALKTLQQQAPSLSPAVLEAGLHAYQYGKAQGDIHKDRLAIVDMALPSSTKRLWVFDMRQDKLLYNTYVAHGRASGDLYAKSFSNTVNSNATSIGVYVTKQEYIGDHGVSLRLQGLEDGFNNHAYERAIVLHAAPYVSDKFLNTYHRLGRSLGCPTVSESLIKPLVNTLKNGAMLMIYYPQHKWLEQSKFLQTQV